MEGAQTRLIPCHLRVLPPPSKEIGYILDGDANRAGRQPGYGLHPQAVGAVGWAQAGK